jgi:hypothetical protein
VFKFEDIIKDLDTIICTAHGHGYFILIEESQSIKQFATSKSFLH